MSTLKLRQWNSKLSLRAKAIGITVGITTVSLAVVAATGMVQIRSQIFAEQHRAADSMAMGFARAAELAIAVRDTRELSRLSNSFLRDENVLFIAAYGEKDKLLAKAIHDHRAWDHFLTGTVDDSHCVVGVQEIEASSGRDEFSAEGGEDLLGNGVESPAPGAQQPHGRLGRVVVGLSTHPALLAQRRQSRVTIAATAAAAVVGAGILFLTLGSWMRRLGRLAEASGSIARGDFSGTISDKANDEIGKLAASFDSMRVTLRDRDQKLRDFTDTLQEQVKQRTRDLETALATAEEANRAKSLFLANMSHELRTPLNGVIGMVDLLLTTEPNRQQARYCEVAKTSARSLLELINDILDFSKIEAGKLELDSTDFDLHEMLESVVSMLGERAEKKNLELVCAVGVSVPQMVSGDPSRLRQVVLNLISNALKFTERGEVVVRAALESQTPTHAVVRVSVRDTGIGIPRDRLDRLFKSFSQVDTSTTRKFGGTGLGLAISQRIVELMGGQIGVESEEGKGSTFWFTTRLEIRPNLPAAHRDLRADPRGLRVLAVDDNMTNREILQAQLTSWSLRPTVADSASQAIEMLHDAVERGEPYRFAILDMHMPHVDGMQLARQIKANPATSDVILISLSSISDTVRPQMMSSMGFSACLTKPALPSQLYNAIVDSLAATQTPGGSAGAMNVAGEAQAPRLAGVRVLLAEDNEVNQLVASELLQQAGCQCTMVVNGREAVDAALRGAYDVILMDCQMPELDGFGATRQIRQAEAADPHHPHRAIIALTANAIKGDRELCLAAGMDGYVTKPIDPVELMQTIYLFLSPQRRASLAEAAAAVAPAPSATPPTPAAPEAPPVDLPSLQKRCMGNHKIAAKALGKFGSSMPVDVQALLDSAGRGDAKAVASAAHKIKGAAANVSAGTLRHIAAQLEELARKDQLSQTEGHLEQLRREMERLQKYLSTALNGMVPPGTAPAAAPVIGTNVIGTNNG